MSTPLKVEVSPSAPAPTHHLSFDDGYTTVGLILASGTVVNPEAITGAPIDRTAMKTTTGSQTYGDFEKPWSPAAQDDFSGGITSRNLEENGNMYTAGQSLNTIHKRMILSGLREYGSGTRGLQTYLPTNMSWAALSSASRKYTALRILAQSVFTAASLTVILRRIGSPTPLVISVHEDNAGEPGTQIATSTVSTATCTDFVSVYHTIPLSRVMAVNDVIWVKFYFAQPDPDHHWLIGSNFTTSYSLTSADGSTWAASEYEPYYTLADADETLYPIFFDYKYAKYLVLSKEGSAPRLFIQGWRGVASVVVDVDGLTDTSQNWADDILVGCTCTLIAGTGSTQKITSRKITANSMNRLYFSPVTVPLDATTQYVISGGTVWNEVTEHGLTSVVTDVLVSNETVYFAQGKSTNIRRMKWDSSGYTWTNDGSNKAEFLVAVREPSATKIWRGTNDPPTVSKASVPTWGTNLSFGTDITFLDYRYGRITRLGEYGDSTKQLWVMREGLPYTISDSNVVEEFPLRQINTMTDANNGKAFLLSNIYLYFNWGPGIYRWYNRDLKDYGPTAAEGMPLETQGYCTVLRDYPGCVYAAFSPYSGTGYSTVYVHNGIGWAELYRSRTAGSRITDMTFQTLGSGETYLWLYDGNNLVRVPTPLRTMVPYKDPLYRYDYEGVFISSYYAANMYNIYKLYNSLVVFSSNLGEHCWVEADYQLDDETEWTPIREHFTFSPIQEVSLRSKDTRLADIFRGVTGKLLRYRLRLYSNDSTVTPIVRSVVIEAISRIPIKYAFTASIKVEDQQRNLLEQDTQISAVDVINQLQEWAAALTPLRMQSIYPEFHDRIVFIESPPMTPTTIDSNQHSLQIVVTEI